MTLSHRQLNKIVKRLALQPNMVLAIKIGTELANQKTLIELAGAIEQTGIKNVILVAVEDLDNIENVSEITMNKHGWWRIETLTRKIIREQ